MVNSEGTSVIQTDKSAAIPKTQKKQNRKGGKQEGSRRAEGGKVGLPREITRSEDSVWRLPR